MRIVKTKQRIKISAVMCSTCEYVLISRHVHQFVTCPCWKESEEKIRNYSGQKYKSNLSYTKRYISFISTMTGIFLDGGNDYQRIGSYGNTKPIPVIMYKIIEKEVE